MEFRPVSSYLKRDISHLGESIALGPERKKLHIEEKFSETSTLPLFKSESHHPSNLQQNGNSYFNFNGSENLPPMTTEVAATASNIIYPIEVEVSTPDPNQNLNKISNLQDEDLEFGHDPLLSLPEYISDALDEFLLTGDAAPLLNLIQQGALQSLNPEAINEIFDLIFCEGHRDLLIALTSTFNLSDDQRNDLLSHALRKNINDIELVKIAINGRPGQQILDFKTWCKHKQIIKFEMLKDKSIDRKIIKYLLSLTPFKKADLKDAKMRQFLSNTWGIDEGEFYIHKDKVHYAGGFAYFFQNLIIDSFKDFFHFNPNVFSLKFLQELEEFIAGSKNKVSSKERLQKYQAHQFVLILGGTHDHQIAFILKDNLLMYCNKGLYSNEPVKIYEIDPSLVTEDMLALLEESRFKLKSNKYGEKYLFETFPNLLKANDATVLAQSLTQQLTQNWQSDHVQTSNNCVWESIRTAIAAFTAVHTWENSGRDDSTLATALKQAYIWESFFLGWSLQTYLAYAVENSRMDTNLLDKVFAQVLYEKYEQPEDMSILYENLEIYYEDLQLNDMGK